MQIDKKEKKPSYMGPRTVNLLVNDQIVETKFSSPITLNDTILVLIGTKPKDSEFVVVHDGGVRISCLYDKIDGVWFHQNQLNSQDKDLYFFTLFMEDGSQVKFPVISVVRLRIYYKILEKLIGKEQSDFNGFVEVAQELNKAAYIRIKGRLIAISTSRS